METIPKQSGGRSSGDEEVFNQAVAMNRIEGDAEIMVSLLNIFFGEISPMMEAVRHAIQNSNAVGLERAAHRLKGSLNVFDATATAATALRLEVLGQNGDLRRAGEIYGVLEEQVRALRPALAEFQRQLQST